MFSSEALNEAQILCLKDILRYIANARISNEYKLLITYKTNQLFNIPEKLKNQYPDNISIIISNDYYHNLKVSDDSFEAFFYFDEDEEFLKVPFANIVSFEVIKKDVEVLLSFKIDQKQTRKNFQNKDLSDNFINLDSFR